jgi:peptidoglycan/LPS O-acetylase OafA/YrhL
MGQRRPGDRHRVAQLDGLRAIAVLAVMAQHSALAFGRGGLFGVDVFFVLSGFLITGVLMGEYERRGTFSLRRFYLRRWLRLYPALIVVIVCLMPIGVTLVPAHTWHQWLVGAGAAATYTSNLLDLSQGRLVQGPLDPTWSLAVEEQFYLLWPLALMGLLALGLRLRWVITIVLTAAAAGLSLFWLTYTAPTTVQPPLSLSGIEAYVRPDARFGELLLGCALSLVLVRRRGPLPVSADRLLSAGVVVAIVGVILARSQYLHALEPGGGNPMAMIPVIAVCATLLVARLATNDRSLLSRVLALRPLPQIGLISYGLYLWHAPIFEVVHPNFLGIPRSEQIVQWTLTFVAAYASYRIVEQPFLRRKDRLRSTPVAGLEAVTAGAPAAAVAPAPEDELAAQPAGEATRRKAHA